jgi:hypothetical protein
MRKIQRPVSKCIFCGIRYANSKEDYWPKWLQPHLPKASPYTLFVTEGSEPRKINARIKGAPTEQTIEVVCKLCNNGWMSRIQNAASAYLKPYSTVGRIMSQPVQEVIATWATIYTMVIEFYDPKLVMATDQDRHAMPFIGKSFSKPPPDWRIYMTRLRSNDDADWFHTGAWVRSGEGELDRALFTRIHFGTVGLIVVRLPGPYQVGYPGLDELCHQSGLHRIWPSQLGTIEFARGLSANKFLFIASLMRQTMLELYAGH